MQNLESIFIKEFRNVVRDVGYKDVFRVPLPEECRGWEVSGTELYGVKGISETYYSVLNYSTVKRLPRGTVAKRRVIDKATRGFRMDSEGNYVYEDYRVPSGSLVVVSDRKIYLPYSEYVKPSPGYGYVDFVITPSGSEFMYVLPKSVLYRVNQTALALSVRDMKGYSGMGYTSWRNGKIFLHIIPYNPSSKYVGSRILKTKHSLDYTSEILEIVSYWQSTGFIPDIRLCGLQDGTNLVTKPTVIGYSEYNPLETLPLSEREVYGVDE